MPLLAGTTRALLALTIAGASLAIAVPAFAHAELVASDPVDGATVEELATVRLEFSEELLDIGNSIVVTDSTGTVQELVVELAAPTVLEAQVAPVAPGDVTIAWRNASVDGHSEEGVLSVTVLAPPPSPSPTPTVTVTATATPSPSPSVTPSPSPSASADPADGTGVSPWLWGVLGLVVIGGAGAAIIAATRRPPTE